MSDKPKTVKKRQTKAEKIAADNLLRQSCFDAGVVEGKRKGEAETREKMRGRELMLRTLEAVAPMAAANAELVHSIANLVQTIERGR